MDCPTCRDERLVIADRQGIEIDYCPRCRGVWLDRGELDKLIERSQPAPAAAAPPPPPSGRYDERARYTGDAARDGYRGDARYGDQHHSGQRKKKRESFLSDLFDF